ncbi:unnamed protein product [Didymodactylos carnosus]|uniref:Uncharacterized protein n=1 Tax=Didymodactylos carnosus TaxID=1234261 RepID=A0A8S2IWS6_9BILA|nr:unnamed protein product [Didymodactylos carnosus]CAF3766978.1 unnamed protein product [Didymodactylos carnosus]
MKLWGSSLEERPIITSTHINNDWANDTTIRIQGANVHLKFLEVYHFNAVTHVGKTIELMGENALIESSLISGNTIDDNRDNGFLFDAISVNEDIGNAGSEIASATLTTKYEIRNNQIVDGRLSILGGVADQGSITGNTFENAALQFNGKAAGFDGSGN